MSKQKFLITLVLAMTMSYLCAQEYEVLYLQQKYDEIVKACTPPQTEKEYFWLAQTLNQQGQILKAINYLESYNDSSVISPTRTLKANLYYQTGQFNKALPYYLATRENEASFLKLMKILEFNGEYISAINYISKRQPSDSTNVELLSILANCYYRSDASIMAINTYEKIYDLNPNDMSSANKLALLLLNSRKEANIRRSIDIADNILENDSTNKRFLRIKGRGHYILSDYHRALPCFKILYDRGYNNLSNCKHLGISEYKVEQYDSARVHLLEAYLIEPNDLQTNLFLGKIFLQLNDAFGALIYLNNADTILLPDDEMMISLLWSKQQCYRDMKSYKQVDTLLHELIKYDRKTNYDFYIASNHENGLKDKEKALAYYERFIIGTNNPVGIKKNKDLRAIAQKRIEKLKEEQFWEEK